MFSLFEHLNRYLSLNDKIWLQFDSGFAVITLEHALCKVARWKKKILQLSEMAKSANAFENFVRDANETNPNAYPFPLSMTKESVENILVQNEVCV